MEIEPSTRGGSSSARRSRERQPPWLEQLMNEKDVEPNAELHSAAQARSGNSSTADKGSSRSKKSSRSGKEASSARPLPACNKDLKCDDCGKQFKRVCNYREHQVRSDIDSRQRVMRCVRAQHPPSPLPRPRNNLLTFLRSISCPYYLALPDAICGESHATTESTFKRVQVRVPVVRPQVHVVSRPPKRAKGRLPIAPPPPWGRRQNPRPNSRHPTRTALSPRRRSSIQAHTRSHQAQMARSGSATGSPLPRRQEKASSSGGRGGGGNKNG